jgi:2-keto-4-pentenoate hydratase/2-oxohepta-3-ene-1,7-dioic acid hydratase in catechol pathway
LKFVTFLNSAGMKRVGLIEQELVIDLYEASAGEIPDNLLDILGASEQYLKNCQSIRTTRTGFYAVENVRLIAPLPAPRSFRDFYAFEQHVKTARQNRGLEMIPEWYESPVFYFSNHLAIKGPEDIIPQPYDCQWLDYELEVACVIGKAGTNIKAVEAEDYIFGYCILNDWSARDLQRKEMKVGLGPAKGKDFATSIGPWIVTKDELAGLKDGKGYNLKMKAYVNGRLLSEGNWKDIYFSFSEMVEQASKGVTLYPGEIIGSGTVGTGCILELGTDVHRWLKAGDIVELQIDKLGSLKNTIM